MKDQSSDRGVHYVAEAFNALADRLDKLMTLHASDADALIRLESAKALALRGSRLSRELLHQRNY